MCKFWVSSFINLSGLQHENVTNETWDDFKYFHTSFFYVQQNSYTIFQNIWTHFHVQEAKGIGTQTFPRSKGYTRWINYTTNLNIHIVIV